MSTAVLNPETSAEARLANSIWYRGALMTVHADSDLTNGAFALIEASAREGDGPPLHVHQREDELFYLLEGQIEVTLGENKSVLNAGGSAFLPRGIPHTFRITSSEARCLVWITPAGFEEYFRILGRPAERLALEENIPYTDPAELIRVGGLFDLTYLV